MPSGHKKRKSAKQKNKALVSAPHQSWPRPHMQMLKTPSFENGTKGKEKHNMTEKEALGNGDRKKGEEKSFFEFKEGEATSTSEMDASGDEGSRVSAISTEEIPSEAENSRKVDVLEVRAFDKPADEVQETEKSELFESSGFSESVISETEAGWSGGLEEKGGEDRDAKEVEVENSLEEVITSQVEEHVPVSEEGEAGQAVGKKAEVIIAHEVDVSACEKEDEVMIDAQGCMEAPQDDERDAITPKIEIPHSPMVVRRASVWNCCGLLEIFMTSQH